MSSPTVEPLSWRAIQWMKSLMASVSPSAGYYSDFSALRLLDDRSQIAAEDGAYVIVVAGDFESLSESTTRNRSHYREDMDVLIEFGIARDATHPELAVHRARHDVLRALRQNIRAADAGITNIQITGSSVGDAPDNSNLIVAQVSARASLTDTTPPAS